MKIAVIGNGIVGSCVGGWLQRHHHEVILIDPLEAGMACSYGNAGSLSPGACLPVGLPGMWKKVPRWLLDPLGPLTVRWSYLPTVLPWLLRLLRHSSRAEVERIAAALRSLLAPVFDSYAPLVERASVTGLVRQNGTLYVYSSADSARRWQWGMQLRQRLGVELLPVGQQELETLEPDLRGRFRFGLRATDNGSTPDPAALTQGIFEQCVRDGAKVIRQRAIGFEQRNGQVRAVQLDNGTTVKVDGVVIAAGAWSAVLTRVLGLRVPLESQRGYHVTLPHSGVQLQHTVMAPEHNLMVNPMHAGLRLAGTVEFAGLLAPPQVARAEALLRQGQAMFPHLCAEGYQHWMGHRPCLPDSLPVIGPIPRVENAWCAFGHGHLGMSSAATTGRELAALISGTPVQVDLSPFAPQRFSR